MDMGSDPDDFYDRLELASSLRERQIRLLKIAERLKSEFNSKMMISEYRRTYPSDNVSDKTLYREISMLEKAGFLLNGAGGKKYIEKRYNVNQGKLDAIKTSAFYNIYYLMRALNAAEALLFFLLVILAGIFAMKYVGHAVYTTLFYYTAGAVSGILMVYILVIIMSEKSGIEIRTFSRKLFESVKRYLK